MKKHILVFSAVILAVSAAEAGQTGAQFLRIDTDARISAMASAGAASAVGVSALNYNPAGLAVLTAPELSFSHGNWLMGSTHDFIGFGIPVKKLAIGVGVTRLSNSSMEGRADDGSAAGGYNAYDQAISLGFGAGYFGGAVKYIQSSIAGVRAEAFAVDLGAKRRLNGLPVSLAVGIQNLGRGIRYLSQRDNLPLSLNAGISFLALPGVALVLDAKRLVYDRQTIFSLGTEYAMLTGPNTGFSLRGGYGLTGLDQGNGKNGLSVGAGLTALGAQLDYAVSPETGLGSVQRLTLKKKF